MRFSGKIEKIDKIIVSDPSYDEDVTCRYERNNLNAKDWKINISIQKVKDEINEKFTIEGIEFFILLQSPKEMCKLKDDGSFSYLSKNKISNVDIGMDTACVALGINSFVDEIKKQKNNWQPECTLNTLTDGFFGNVKEGKKDNTVNFIWINGYLSEDTGYSIKDIVEYLTETFEIKNLYQEIKYPLCDKDVECNI